MTEQQNRPLWEVMEEAMVSTLPWPKSASYNQGVRRARAAELRAIADAVVPESLCDALDGWDYTAIAYSTVRQRLLDAVDEAENG